jgi:hypothetical protein
MATKKFDELTDRDLFASLIFLGYVLRAGQVTDMTNEAINSVQLADKLIAALQGDLKQTSDDAAGAPKPSSN